MKNQIAQTEASPTRISGKWAPGVSGNPNGRPRTSPEIREALARQTPRAIEAIGEILNSPETRASDRLRAAELVLAYHIGKPVQTIEHEEGPIEIFVRHDVDGI